MRFPARFPWRFGAHDPTLEQEHQAILDYLAPGWDVGSESEANIEAKTDALAITMLWAINRRAGNQAFPLKMQDALADWETIMRIRVGRNDTLVDRRRRIASRLRGVTRNALSDLEEAARTALGDNFEALVPVPDADRVAYWPGVNPGPPGYEFSSNTAHIAIRMNKNGLNEPTFLRKVENLANTLDHMRPAWLTYEIGTGTEFIVGETIIGHALI